MQCEYTYNFYEFFYDTSFHDYKNTRLIGVSVKIGTHRVNVNWNPVEVTNLHDVYAIDAEAELVAILAAEIDTEIINDLRLMVR